MARKNPNQTTCPVCLALVASTTKTETPEATMTSYYHDGAAAPCVTVQPIALPREARIARALLKALRAPMSEVVWGAATPPERVEMLREAATTAGLDYGEVLSWLEGVPTEDLMQ